MKVYAVQLINQASSLTGDEEMMEEPCVFLEGVKGRRLGVL